MIFKVYLLSLVCIFLVKITLALPYSRRQTNLPEKDGLPFEKQLTRLKRQSGSIMGTYYYGVGSDPNYGSFIAPQNRPNSNGIVPISYNANSNLFNNLINPSNQQQNYLYNSNNAWQNPNTNNYYNNPNSRYPPGSQGWYATGGNYWYNKGLSLNAHPRLLILGILSLIIWQ